MTSQGHPLDDLPEDLRRGLLRFVDVLEAKWGDSLVSVVVFGSYVTGSAHPESDLDVLLVKADLPRSRLVRRHLISVEEARRRDARRHRLHDHPHARRGSDRQAVLSGHARWARHSIRSATVLRSHPGAAQRTTRGTRHRTAHRSRQLHLLGVERNARPGEPLIL